VSTTERASGGEERSRGAGPASTAAAGEERSRGAGPASTGAAGEERSRGAGPASTGAAGEERSRGAGPASTGAANTLVARPPLRSLVEDLHERRAQARSGGGPEKIERQHEQGKLTARERLDALIDAGTFTELGIHGRPHFSQRAMEGKEAPADGVVTGYGKVEGRLVAVCAYDFTVMAGSMGMTGELKVSRLRDLALGKRIPFIWLLDSAGARIQEASGSLFAGSGHLFREEVVMSGVIPQIAALMGPCAAGTAYIPGLADFVPMVKGRGSMALAGPHLTKAVTGEDVTQEELGGSRVHTRISGVADLEVESDEECIQAIKDYLSFFPQNCEERPPVRESADPSERMDDELVDVLPDSPRKPYDMYDVIRRIVDDGFYFDLKPRWARTIITCLARMGGRPVGIVANQPRQLGGILENDSADKAARFINLCDAFGIPLLFLQDVPGFMVGTKVEQAGIIRHGAKMLYAVSRATVPKITVVVRKAYGAGYYVMCGKAYEPDLIVAWPSAEISVMGPEGAVNIIFRKRIEASEDPDATRAEMIDGIREIIDPYIAAGNAMIDDIIDPRETRPTVIRALEMAETKRVQRPWKRHGVMPV
jgi:acetyl-CoA carboxylase carboxyltransferase component